VVSVGACFSVTRGCSGGRALVRASLLETCQPPAQACVQRCVREWVVPSTYPVSSASLFLFAANEDFRSLSIQVAGSCAVMSRAGDEKAVCLLTSLCGRKIALLEIHVAALVRSQRGHSAGRDLSVLPRAHVLSTSPLHFRPAEENRTQPAPQRQSAVRSTIKDQPLVFHSKVKSSGYASTPHVTLFSPKTNTRSSGDRSLPRRACHRWYVTSLPEVNV